MLLGSYRLLMVAAVSYVLYWTYNELHLMIKYVTLFIGMSIGIVIGFSVYHYFFMEKFSCCGVYG